MRSLITIAAGLMLFLAGCGSTTPSGVGPATTADAQQLPAQAQAYIEMSREALSEQLGVEPEAIMLDSITTPATEDGVYIVKLEVGDQVYEYHGRADEVLLVSEPLPTAPRTD